MKNKLSPKQILIVASTLFGMIFGAGNLIFPVHMGQLAGSNFIPATLGFVITGVGIPILGIVAIGYSESKGLFSLTSKVGKYFAYIYTTILYLAIGPLCVMPRSASISFGAGLSSIIGDSFNQDLAFLIFSVIFFAITLFFSLRPSGITTSVGKIINPFFLAFLFLLIIVALANPLANVFEVQPSPDYETQSFFHGFIEGYGTMDALAGLAFGIILIDIVKRMGSREPRAITKNIMIPSVLTGCLMMAIYALTIIMGVESRGGFDVSSNGSIALSQISNNYFGIWGDIVLTTIVTLGSLKTSIGLVTSCSATFYEMLPGKKISYEVWCVICVVMGIAISNIGLDNILTFSQPILSFLCPLAIVIIIMAFICKRFNYSKVIYQWTIYITCIPALFDLLRTLPPQLISTLNLEGVINFGRAIFPFMDIGFAWVIPATIGFLIGIIIYKVKNSKKVSHEKVA